MSSVTVTCRIMSSDYSLHMTFAVHTPAMFFAQLTNSSTVHGFPLSLANVCRLSRSYCWNRLLLDIDNCYCYFYRQHCAQRWYFGYSGVILRFFCHAGTTRCIDGGEIWHGGVDRNTGAVCCAQCWRYK